MYSSWNIDGNTHFFPTHEPRDIFWCTKKSDFVAKNSTKNGKQKTHDSHMQ